MSSISNWYVLQVDDRHKDFPSYIELQSTSRAFCEISLYVDTLLAPEMVTQVSSVSTVYHGPGQVGVAVDVVVAVAVPLRA